MQALQYLRSRGLIYQSSQLIEDALKSITSRQSIYLGVDPTAKGLHIGHLIACRVLKQFYKSGIRSIALIGGATALIGDPSFKVKERNVLSFEAVQANVTEIRKDIERVLESSGDENLVFVNNYDWYKDMSMIQFLRDVGKYMRVQTMLMKDSVQKRINSENSMSFAEFSYQCMQSYDYFHLNQKYGCICQIGGSDQWGNITSGIDYVKQVSNQAVHGLTVQLLTNKHGQKFGKSEGNAIWINKSRTSNNDYYQFFLRVEDSDVAQLLRVLTDLPEASINEIVTEHAKNPEIREAQQILAEELFLSTRSAADLQKAKRCAEVLYGDQEVLTESLIRDIMDELPMDTLDATIVHGKSIADYLVMLKFAESKKAAKRLIQGGGVRLNGHVISQPTYIVTNKDMIDSCLLPVSVGKKNRKFALVKLGVCFEISNSKFFESKCQQTMP